MSNRWISLMADREAWEKAREDALRRYEQAMREADAKRGTPEFQDAMSEVREAHEQLRAIDASRPS